MKWSLFKKSREDGGKTPKGTESAKQQNEKSNNESMDEIFLQKVNERRQEDPLVGAKIGAKEFVGNLINGMKDTKGVHIESLVSILGSLAGYSCQASLRKEYIETRGLPENQVFTIVEAKNGTRYYFGDMVNKPLAEDQLSVWSLAAGMVHHLGCSQFPDLNDIFKYVTGTVGQDNFGIPRIPEGHKPGDIPYEYVASLWPMFLRAAERYCASPLEWPVMGGMALQEAIQMGKDVLDPQLALSIAMECAVPMAKADVKVK